MSKYCGKCDVWDWFEGKTEEDIQNTDFYFSDNSLVKLQINNKKDLLSIAPHIIGMAINNGQSGIVYISKLSYIDTYENEVLGWYCSDINRYLTSCKRKKTSPNFEEFKKKIYYGGENFDVLEELYLRAINDGVKKYDSYGLHLKSHNRMRKDWYDDLIAAGYDKNSLPSYKNYFKYYKQDENTKVDNNE